MVGAVRNIGWRGVCATAIAAVDVALWDLKAKLLDRPLVQLLGAARSAVPIYGSGGFTSYSPDRLTEQLAHWVENEGCRWVKMKGRRPLRSEGDGVREGAAGNLRHHPRDAADRERDADIPLRPVVLGEIERHKGSKAGLHIGDEEIHPIEAMPTLRRGARMQRFARRAIAHDRAMDVRVTTAHWHSMGQIAAGSVGHSR
jgi:L-alanine-DL-glutamate epimerase-like enolase superfamily enzyme